MLNCWSFNWESMAARESESLETRCVESFLVNCVSVLLTELHALILQLLARAIQIYRKSTRTTYLRLFNKI
jgi:hypothetical protein